MSDFRIVPAFLLVALIHVMVIAGFVTTVNAPPPFRQVRSEAMMAQLLQSEPRSARSSAAVQTPVKPPHAQTTRTALRASREIAAGAPPQQTSPSVPTDARPPSAKAKDAIAPAGAASPGQPRQPPKQATADHGPASAQAVATAPAAPSNASSSATRETVAQAPAAALDHADCRIAKPAYPELSKRRGETGTATVRFVVGTGGAIDEIVIAKSSGFARLDEAAIEALRQSTCRPQVENGAPVRASYVQAFMFGLDDE
jgi:protein TonB